MNSGETLGNRLRVELAEFLRGRRAQVTPEMAGLPQTRRRRTPGLRREEVAELAGISTALYAWLEQAREVPVSRHTLDAIATALQLSSDERVHVQNLGRPEHEVAEAFVSSSLRRMVLSLPTHPTYVLDQTWEIVLENEAAQAVFGPTVDDGLESNLMKRVLLNPASRGLLRDWETTAQGLIERFQFDYAAHAADPRMQSLLDELHKEPLFARIWDTRRVRRYNTGVLRLSLDEGEMTFETSSYIVTESTGLRVLIFTPYDVATAQRMLSLVDCVWFQQRAS